MPEGRQRIDRCGHPLAGWRLDASFPNLKFRSFNWLRYPASQAVFGSASFLFGTRIQYAAAQREPGIRPRGKKPRGPAKVGATHEFRRPRGAASVALCRQIGALANARLDCREAWLGCWLPRHCGENTQMAGLKTLTEPCDHPWHLGETAEHPAGWNR